MNSSSSNPSSQCINDYYSNQYDTENQYVMIISQQVFRETSNHRLRIRTYLFALFYRPQSINDVFHARHRGESSHVRITAVANQRGNQRDSGRLVAARLALVVAQDFAFPVSTDHLEQMKTATMGGKKLDSKSSLVLFGCRMSILTAFRLTFVIFKIRISTVAMKIIFSSQLASVSSLDEPPSANIGQYLVKYIASLDAILTSSALVVGLMNLVVLYRRQNE